MHLSAARPKERTLYCIAKSFRNERGISTKKNMFRLGTLAEIREWKEKLRTHGDGLNESLSGATKRCELANKKLP